MWRAKRALHQRVNDGKLLIAVHPRMWYVEEVTFNWGVRRYGPDLK